MAIRYGDGLDAAFEKAGVTANDRNTNAYNHIKVALKEHPEIVIGEDLGDTLKRAALINAELKKQIGTAREALIMDSKLRDAINGFGATIRAVQDVFGEENMTEAVICKAIEAGSFIGYRTIMGEAANGGRR